MQVDRVAQPSATATTNSCQRSKSTVAERFDLYNCNNKLFFINSIFYRESQKNVFLHLKYSAGCFQNVRSRMKLSNLYN